MKTNRVSAESRPTPLPRSAREGLSPPKGEMMRTLLAAAPSVLRVHGYTPDPKPYRPRGWLSYLWVGSADGRRAVALPTPTIDLNEVARRVGGIGPWRLRSGRGSVAPDVIYLIVPETNPVQLEASRTGRRPALEIVRVPLPPGAPPPHVPDAPFRHELRITVSYGGGP